ncbi:methyltransferase domain-containing protein [Streptomyces sp. N2-109]|uniref:Methyltransferase domain-containing protein n=1 Tax=Streptomyces gossypii TaxID=2883101 RepID=A0ABT2K1G1_9ACTN|nr:class I SAM-dependent methyltransferase [Streptomyces gossypii]MCT2594017.1 methyltransferase domain-containing protein [Streptomyces gossypii]
MTTVDYDQHAAEYARHRRPYSGLVEHLIEYAGLTSSSRVLEVGCGTANHLAGVQQETGSRAVGVDPSAEMLHAAADHPAELELLRGRAEELDFPEESFDLIFSIDVIHHLPDPGPYFSRAFRALKPGGLLCTATDSEWIIRNRVPVARYFPATVDAELARYHPVPALAASQRAAGFSTEHERVLESFYELTDAASYSQKAFSVLHLISEQDFEEGLTALRADLEKGPIEANMRICALWSRKPA